jgi:hypothetical protein
MKEDEGRKMKVKERTTKGTTEGRKEGRKRNVPRLVKRVANRDGFIPSVMQARRGATGKNCVARELQIEGL